MSFPLVIHSALQVSTVDPKRREREGSTRVPTSVWKAGERKATWASQELRGFRHDRAQLQGGWTSWGEGKEGNLVLWTYSVYLYRAMTFFFNGEKQNPQHFSEEETVFEESDRKGRAATQYNGLAKR